MTHQVDLRGSGRCLQLRDQVVEAAQDVVHALQAEEGIVLERREVAVGIAVAREAHRLRLELPGGPEAPVDEDDGIAVEFGGAGSDGGAEQERGRHDRGADSTESLE